MGERVEVKSQRLIDVEDRRFKIKGIFKVEKGGMIIVSTDHQCFDDDGNIELEYAYNTIEKYEDGSTRVYLASKGVYTLIEEDGRFFKYGDRTTFQNLERKKDGTTLISDDDGDGYGYDTFQISVNVDGKAFEFEGEKVFPYISKNDNGAMIISLKNGSCVYVKPNGDYIGHNDGHKIENFTMYDDGWTQLFLGDARYLLSKPNGELFSLNGSSEFSFIKRIYTNNGFITHTIVGSSDYYYDDKGSEID